MLLLLLGSAVILIISWRRRFRCQRLDGLIHGAGQSVGGLPRLGFTTAHEPWRDSRAVVRAIVS